MSTQVVRVAWVLLAGYIVLATLLQVADGTGLGEAAISTARVTLIGGAAGAAGVTVFFAAVLSLKWIAERLLAGFKKRRLRSRYR